MSEDRELRLRIRGVRRLFPTEEPAVTVQEVDASYFYQRDAHYLFYAECPEGSGQALRTRVKRRGTLLEIHRQGPFGNSMVFEPGKAYRTEYATPFGTLPLDVVTRSVEVMPPGDAEEYGAGNGAGYGTENGAGNAPVGEERVWQDVRIVYTLEYQGESLGEYELYIERI